MRIITSVLLIILFCANFGCEQPLKSNNIPTKINGDIGKLSFYASYSPVKIDIMPLTEFTGPGDNQQSQIKIYVSLLDTFGCQIKSPAVFRFELYEFMPRSAKPKGKRTVIWPDIDLTDPVTNNDYWRDFLRTYEFNLPSEQAKSQDYILQVTCLCPNGKRLSSEYTLRQPK